MLLLWRRETKEVQLQPDARPAICGFASA